MFAVSVMTALLAFLRLRVVTVGGPAPPVAAAARHLRRGDQQFRVVTAHGRAHRADVHAHPR